MPVGHARVDDRDADAGAVEAERILDPGRADGRTGALQRPVHRAVEADAVHAGQARKRGQRRVGHAGDQAAARGRRRPRLPRRLRMTASAASAGTPGLSRRMTREFPRGALARSRSARSSFAMTDPSRRQAEQPPPRAPAPEKNAKSAEDEQSSNHFAGCGSCAAAARSRANADTRTQAVAGVQSICRYRRTGRQKFKLLIGQHLRN